MKTQRTEAEIRRDLRLWTHDLIEKRLTDEYQEIQEDMFDWVLDVRNEAFTRGWKEAKGETRDINSNL